MACFLFWLVLLSPLILHTSIIVLQLTDVSLQDSNPTDLNQKEMVARASEFKRSMQEHPLRFGFLDGHVEHICPSQEEQTWVLNIKRGVLSALQNTMPTLESSVRQREVSRSHVPCTQSDFKMMDQHQLMSTNNKTRLDQHLVFVDNVP